jgi:hypothetical protein
MLGCVGSETSALDIVTVVIAGYAALVGTFALAFQAISWLRSWSTRVKCGRYELHSVGADPETVVLIRMINHSGHEVKITSVGWGQQRRKGPAFVITRPWPLELPLPFTIAPRDSQDVWTKPGMLNLDLDRKVRAQVSTSDGKLFKSKRISARNLAEGRAVGGSARSATALPRRRRVYGRCGSTNCGTRSARSPSTAPVSWRSRCGWVTRSLRRPSATCTSRSRGPRRIVLGGRLARLLLLLGRWLQPESNGHRVVVVPQHELWDKADLAR